MTALGLTIVCGSLVVTAAAMHFSSWSAPVNVQDIPGTNGDVNTAFNDGCPIQSPDGLSLYMASNRSPGGLGGQDIWVAHRAGKHEPFGAPENLGAPVNSSADDFCPTPLRGKRLLFVSARPGGCGGPDIYITRENPAHGWNVPENLGCEVNSPAGEAGPSLVKTNGKAILFFSSARAGGFAADGATPPFDSDIYLSPQLRDGSFAAAQLVPGLNTAADDSRPNVRRDSREIVFDSNRPAGAPTAPTNDIYTATRASATDAWSAPILLDSVSSAANDTRASLSWDGTTLVFGSNRPGSEGQADIYLSTREKVKP
jgi:Tol biopolymer transport system component